jgi:hypothetical protein
MVHHAHATVGYSDAIEIEGHYIDSFAQAEAPDNDLTGLAPEQPDGSLKVYGGALKMPQNHFGFLYAGFSHIEARDALTVGNAVEVLHAQGGGEFNLGVTDVYLNGPTAASGGTGSVDTLMAQYELSLRNVLMGIDGVEEQFWGGDADVYLKAYGMMNMVKSEDDFMDGVTKLKFGGDVQYDFLRFMGAGLRVDRLQPNSDVPEQSWSVVSPRLIFRSQFVTREQVEIMYSRYFYRDRGCEADPVPCVQSPSAPIAYQGFGSDSNAQDENTRAVAAGSLPDRHMITVAAQMWW